MFQFQQEFFERTADRQPGSIAVDDDDAVVSYGALEEQANRLAHLLREVGCGPGARVCIFTGKNAHMYTAVLGALKAKGCWVPLSSAFPVDRLRYLIETLAPIAIIVDETTVDMAHETCGKATATCAVVLLGGTSSRSPRAVIDDATISARPCDRLDCAGLTGEDLAYVIFTSGSTGAPKGVMVRHRSTAQFLSLCRSFFDIAGGSRFAHFSDLTFDPSIFDLFHCWHTGGVLVPANRRTYRIDPARFLAQQRVNVLFTVPTALASIRESGQMGSPALASVRHLLLTGEPVPAQLVRDWYSAYPEVTIYNMYGTTETSIVSHWCRIPQDQPVDEPVPLGRPLPGLRITLMDGDEPAADGCSGEALVTGTQMAAGYWANPFQTERSFVPDPTRPTLPVLAYRTGDILREGRDGCHYFVGRIDAQVKLRGHRVELGEIENTLLSNDLVLEAAVVVVERSGSGSCLVAFVKAADPGVAWRALQQELIRRLPGYMVPERVVVMPGDMPSGATGKLDRSALTRLATEILATDESIRP